MFKYRLVKSMNNLYYLQNLYCIQRKFIFFKWKIIKCYFNYEKALGDFIVRSNYKLNLTHILFESEYFEEQDV